MSLGRFVAVAGGVWLVAISLLHFWLNWEWRRADSFRVGFLPVT
jgi:hypothetical protein